MTSRAFQAAMLAPQKRHCQPIIADSLFPKNRKKQHTAEISIEPPARGKPTQKPWHQVPLSTPEQTPLLKTAFKGWHFIPMRIKSVRIQKHPDAASPSFSDAGNQPENVLNVHLILLIVLLQKDRLFQAGFQHLRLPDGPRRSRGK